MHVKKNVGIILFKISVRLNLFVFGDLASYFWTSIAFGNSIFADAEIKVHSVENPELTKVLPLTGVGMAQWQSNGLVIERSRVRVPAEAAGEFSSPRLNFCAGSYFCIRSIPVLPQ